VNLLSDVIVYFRRIVKSPSNAQLSDNLIIDYINRFVTSDMDMRIQLFDYKTKYGFMCTPYITHYNMPYYGVNQFKTQVQGSPAPMSISPYPVYQGLRGPCYINGILAPFYTQREEFYSSWAPYLQNIQATAVGDGTPGPYTMSLPFFPCPAGHVDVTGIITVGSTQDPIVGTSLNTNVPITSLTPGVIITALDTSNYLQTVTDSGQFLNTDQTTGFLQTQNSTTPQVIQAAGQVNYVTGATTVTFSANIGVGQPIQASCYFYQPGIPTAALFYNNEITLLPPPNQPYYIQFDAYLTPAAYLQSASPIQFGYMSEYIARGAARKMLSDTGDMEQFNFYEPFFREQEQLVWKKSQRILTSTPTPSFFSTPGGGNPSNLNWTGSSV
jgi:hypothetical protein